MKCVVPGCPDVRETAHQSGGYCTPHRRGWTVNGTPNPPIHYRSPLAQEVEALGMTEIFARVTRGHQQDRDHARHLAAQSVTDPTTDGEAA